MNFMSFNPFFTLYVVNHNYSTYLEEALESIRNQTFDDFEVLIFDDGSSDESLDIIDAYLSKFALEWRLFSGPNQGLISIIDRAFKQARGSFVVRLDADDILHENFLEAYYTAIQNSHKAIACLFCNHDEIDINGKFLRKVEYNFVAQRSIMAHEPCHGACTVFRKEIYESFGGINPNVTRQDGLDLWLSLIDKHEITHVNESLFSYRKHGTSLSDNRLAIYAAKANIFETHFLSKKNDVTYQIVLPINNDISNLIYSKSNLFHANFIQKICRTIQRNSYFENVTIYSEQGNILATDLFKMLKKNDINVRYLCKAERAGDNVSLQDELDMVFGSDGKLVAYYFINYPGHQERYLDLAFFMMNLFDYTSVISVQEKSSNLYRLSGNKLEVLNVANRRVESEKVMSKAGGVLFKNYKSKTNLDSYLMIDDMSALEITNPVYKVLLGEHDAIDS